MEKPHCVRCLKLMGDMTAEEIFSCQRIALDEKWGKVRQVVCPGCLDREPEVVTCAECGGKYRPAGGPCIHEQRSEMWAQAAGPANTRFATGSVEAARREVTGYDCRCGQCGVLWQPGHTCIRQPTEREVQSLRDEADFLQLVAATIIKLSSALRVATPEVWEVL